MYLQVFDFLAKLYHSIYSNNIHLNSQPIRTKKILAIKYVNTAKFEEIQCFNITLIVKGIPAYILKYVLLKEITIVMFLTSFLHQT